MSRNFLLGLVGLLTIIAAVTGYLYYEERQTGLDININENGITIEGK